MKAILFVSHGSRLYQTKNEIKKLVRILKTKSRISIFEYAFLEIESPSIPKGIDICVKKGAGEVILLLNFLNAGRHVDIDIPRIIKEARQKYPRVKFNVTKPVGQHPGMVDLFLGMIKKSDKRQRGKRGK